jgi:ABC-type transport system involved in cytochrome c biogenesis permease subunit
MDIILPVLNTFTQVGNYIIAALALLSAYLGVVGTVNLIRTAPTCQRTAGVFLWLVNLFFLIGFLWICWFHYRIYSLLPLELPGNLVGWLNQQLTTMNQKAAYGLPLYEMQNPPRYIIPLWIENEKYYFWFFFYGIMALYAHYRLPQHRFRGVVYLFLTIQVFIVTFITNPFQEPLPQFFNEISPWFAGEHAPMARLGLFMRLYPKMIFYYNAEYMWFHPPLLFIAYACITITFITSVFMLVRRELEIEILGYDSAKLGYLMLTLGMLLGYPWALKAWGPNWWWDPKICSSIMMWAVFSTYLHARLYANKPAMWYFSSILGILCFMAMVFTFVSSFLFPGEHTFQ